MIIIETCPKCGHDLQDEVICTYPPIPRKVCWNCGWTNKMTISIGGHFDLIKHIERNLIDNNLIAEFDRKVNKRHEEDDRDGEYRSLQLSGKIQGLKVLHYIYDDATIYLDRKYEKFLEIVAKLEGTV